MKHGSELVIIGLAAKQGCSYLKRQATGTQLNSAEWWTHIKTSNIAQRSILRLSNFRLQNSSNLDGPIQWMILKTGNKRHNHNLFCDPTSHLLLSLIQTNSLRHTVILLRHFTFLNYLLTLYLCCRCCFFGFVLVLPSCPKFPPD